MNTELMPRATLMKELRAEWRDLPPGSFAESGTYCNALILRVRARG